MLPFLRSLSFIWPRFLLVYLNLRNCISITLKIYEKELTSFIKVPASCHPTQFKPIEEKEKHQKIITFVFNNNSSCLVFKFNTMIFSYKFTKIKSEYLISNHRKCMIQKYNIGYLYVRLRFGLIYQLILI